MLILLCIRYANFWISGRSKMSITVHGISDEDAAILDILWELKTQ